MNRALFVLICLLMTSVMGCGVIEQLTGEDKSPAQTSQNQVQSKQQSPSKGTSNNTPQTQIVLVGDEDNMGLSFQGADKYSGRQITAGYPQGPSDTVGTDTIMVGNSYKGTSTKIDGYCSSTKRPANNPQYITFNFSIPQKGVNSAQIGIYAIDFQAPVFKSHFTATLDGRPADFISGKLNSLDQTGPVGQYISFAIPSDFLNLLSDGQLVLYIDDPSTGAGDGYAIDFARLVLQANQ